MLKILLSIPVLSGSILIPQNDKDKLKAADITAKGNSNKRKNIFP